MSELQKAAQRQAPSDLTPALVARLAKYLKGTSGVCIEADKQYLIESKLRPILQKERMKSFGELVDAIEQNRTSRLAEQVTQVMTINETHFFRDRVPFDTLAELLPPLALRRVQERTLRVWSAACSTGQELYSIAMTIEEQASLFHNWKVELIGTDISDAVVAKAKKGCYSQFEVQRGLPTAMLLKYFERDGDEWSVNSRIRKRTNFQRANLIDGPVMGMFDIVFCRNVLFYFEPATRLRILSRIADALRPDGYLVLGSSEAMTALAAGFRQSSPGSCYYTRSQAGAASKGTAQAARA